MAAPVGVEAKALRARKPVAWLIMASMTLAFVVAHVSTNPALRNFFDNVQWTCANGGAAVLAWLGYRGRRDADHPTRTWFFWGLGLYALGQLIWDVQIAADWVPFPAPSDVFYAASGPCIAIGLWLSLRNRMSSGRARIVGLDLAIILTQTLALILLAYLANVQPVTSLELLQLSIYPVVLIGSVLVGLLAALELGLRPHWRWMLLLGGLCLRALAWMRWNLISLHGAPASGAWLNYSFAVASLMEGVGIAYWDIASVQRTASHRPRAAFHVFIPVVPVVAAVMLVYVVWEEVALPRQLRVLTTLGAAAVIVLSAVRQSFGLAERERLLQAERLMAEKDQQFRQLGERLEIAASAAHLGIWEIDLTRRHAVWDANMFKVCGHDPACGLAPYDLWEQQVHPDDLGNVRAAILDAAASNADLQVEFRMVFPDGSLHYLEAFGKAGYDSGGRPVRMTGVAWDITQRVLARRALAESEAELRAIFENSVIGVVLIDDHRNIVRHNKAVRDFLGYDMQMASQLTADDIIHPDEQEQSRRQFAELLTGKRSSYQVERRYRHGNGEYRWVRASIYPVNLHSRRCFVVLVEDIQDRKQMQMALEAARDKELQMREEFAFHLLNVQEQERQRMANELHDSLGQSLSVIKNRAQLALEGVGLNTPPAAQLQGIVRVTSDAIAETRRLAHNLRPLHIEQLGLTAAMEQLLEQFREASQVPVVSRLENIDDAFGADHLTHVYRLVQEALNNISKHARATQVKMLVERDLHVVRIRIEDNGCGFDPELMHHAGLGLISMTERAHMLGGQVQVVSHPGGGTMVIIELPVHDADQAVS
jgi:PAS domain S-box-containing protein